MKRRNKVVSVLLALCMLLSLLPAAAFAEELPAEEPAVEEPAEPETPAAEEETPAEPEAPAEPEEETPVAVQSAADNGIAVQAADTPTAALDLKNISETNLQGATYTNGIYTKSAGMGNWTWDPTNKILTLNNCDIKPMDESGDPLEINGVEFPDGDVKLVLNGGNHISAPGGSYAIYGGDNLTLTISGDGWLDTLAKSAHIRCGNLVLQSGSVNLQAGQVESAGVWVTNLTVNGGTLSAMNFKARAILAGTAVTINGGCVTASVTSGSAIAGTNNITVNSEATISGGESAEGATTVTGVNYKYLDITVPAPAAPTFADGFGKTDCTFDSYTEGDKNDKGYTFAGWFDGDTKLASAAAAESSKTYTAKWTMNGKTVRTTELDLSDQTSDISNTDEGWSWNAATKTLTLSGVTFDVTVTAGADREEAAAIELPDNAVIVLADGTQNTVLSKAAAGESAYIYGVLSYAEYEENGVLTINGTGKLSVTGPDGGLCANGYLAINAPITAEAANKGNGGAAISSVCGITLASSLCVTEPEGGRVMNSAYLGTIVDSQGYSAEKVVITYAAKFADGFGNAVAAADAKGYVRGTTTNDKGYTFDGWVGSDDSIVFSAADAIPGVTYTARWTNNGKTVRTTELDLSDQTADISNTDEGWSWNAATKTLTLNGVTFDVNKDAFQVIQLPDGAAIVTEKGPENVLSNSSEITGVTPAEWGSFAGGGIVGMGKLTIKGEGALSVNGGCFGVFTMGDLTIDAPVSANCTEDDEHVYAIFADDESTISIDPSLCIKTPANGKVGSDKALRDGEFIAESDGKTPAKKVVIELADPAFADGLGKTGCTFNTYTKGQKNAKGYTFMGWFDGNNKELTDVTKAAPGVTYTARWQAGNGKLVRTTPLDLSQKTVDAQDIAEGWSWNAATKTLTLNGVTFDVYEDNALAAIYLPDGAAITTVQGTKNIVVNRSLLSYGVPEGFDPFVGSSIMSDGALTIAGEGDLSITGGSCGVLTLGKLTIKAPFSVTCTEDPERGYIYALIVHSKDNNVVSADMISIDPSLRIKTPANGKIVAETISDDFGGDTTVTKALAFVVDGSGKAATELVIEKASSGGSSSGGSYNGTQSTVTSDLTSVTRVTVDGKTVSPKNYTVSGGNITFTDAFLKTLSNGLHKVTIENDKYIARGTFNVNNPAGTGAANSPKTADAGIALYAAMAAASLLGSGVVFTRKRRAF